MSVHPGIGRPGFRYMLDPPTRPTVAVSGISMARRVLAMALLGAGLIHLAVFPSHLEEWWLAGVFFGGTAAFQLAAAGAVAFSPRHELVLGAIAVSAGSVVLWAASRIWGMPFGPMAGVVEPVGLPDALTVLLEVLACVAALVWWSGRGSRHAAARTHRYARALTVGAAAFVAVLAAAGVRPALSDEGHHGAAEPVDVATPTGDRSGAASGPAPTAASSSGHQHSGSGAHDAE